MKIPTNKMTGGGDAVRKGSEETQKSNERNDIVGDKTDVKLNICHVSARSEDNFTGTNPYG